MKKSLVLLIILVVSAVSVIYFGQTSILAEKNQVQITEHVLLGDKSVVEGVTLEMNTTYEDQLFWDTTYVIGEEPSVSTEYTFYQTRQNNYFTKRDGYIYFNESYVHEFGWTQDHSQYELEGLELAMQELYDSLGPFEDGMQTILLKDYVDYYHFSVDIEGPYDSAKSPNHMYFFNMEESALESEIEQGKLLGNDTDSLEKQLEWLKTFQDFFKIPVLDNEANVIVMEKDGSGNVTGWGISSVSGGSGTGEVNIPEAPSLDQYDAFRFETKYSVEEGDIYFTFDTHSFNGQVVDTSLIPGGYGIYHFPYDEEKEEIYPEELQMVYELDPNIIVFDMTRDFSGENLLLFTVEEKTKYMSVIDIATMTLENKLELASTGYGIDGYGIEHYALYEDYMVINGENLIVITIDENGNYRKEFEVSKSPIEELNIDETGMTQIPAADTVYDWDGEKLLFANYIFNYNGYLGTSFYVGAVGEEGVLYFGTYDSSLRSTVSKDSNGYANYNYPHCRPVNDGGISVQWK